jgi:predicted ribosome quality control (RQC) complex YloA/Tae2 family protein
MSSIMSLTFSQMQQICKAIKPLIEGVNFIQFFELSSRKFLLKLKRDKKLIHLLMCFQEPFLRFHLVEGKFFPRSSPFSERITNRLEGKTLVDCSLVNEDRILLLTFQEKNQKSYLVAEFFPRKPNLYLLNSNQEQIQESWNPTDDEKYQFPQKPERKASLSQKNTTLEVSDSTAIQKFYEEQEQKEEFRRKKNHISSRLRKLLKRVEKGLQQTTSHIQRCQEWQRIQHEGVLLQSNLYRMRKGMTELAVLDWEKNGEECFISLNPQREPSEDVAKRFRQSKKLRLGLEYAQLDLRKWEKERDLRQHQMQMLDAIDSLPDLERFYRDVIPLSEEKSPLKAQQTVVRLPYHEYVTATGLRIWVGKNDKSNEQLTFQLARGSDWWLHTRNDPGAHVILRCRKGSDPDEESILDAIQLALRYSKAKGRGEAEVCLSQCKYVSRLGKGKIGKVQISKHQVVLAKIDEERWQQLKSSLRFTPNLPL